MGAEEFPGWDEADGLADLMGYAAELEHALVLALRDRENPLDATAPDYRPVLGPRERAALQEDLKTVLNDDEMTDSEKALAVTRARKLDRDGITSGVPVEFRRLRAVTGK